MNIRHAITRRALLALALVVMLGSLGTSCKDKFYGEARLIEYPCPLLPITPARRTIIPHSQSFSLAMFNFIDQTGKAGSYGTAWQTGFPAHFFRRDRVVNLPLQGQHRLAGNQKHKDFVIVLQTVPPREQQHTLSVSIQPNKRL